MIVKARIYSAIRISITLSHKRLEKQLKSASQTKPLWGFEVSDGQNMFHRDCIVSLKTGDRFIAKEYQSRRPLRDKYLHLIFFSLRDKEPRWWSCLAFQMASFPSPKQTLNIPSGYPAQRLSLCLLLIMQKPGKLIWEFAWVDMVHNQNQLYSPRSLRVQGVSLATTGVKIHAVEVQ